VINKVNKRVEKKVRIVNSVPLINGILDEIEDINNTNGYPNMLIVQLMGLFFYSILVYNFMDLTKNILPLIGQYFIFINTFDYIVRKIQIKSAGNIMTLFDKKNPLEFSMKKIKDLKSLMKKNNISVGRMANQKRMSLDYEAKELTSMVAAFNDEDVRNNKDLMNILAKVENKGLKKDLLKLCEKKVVGESDLFNFKEEDSKKKAVTMKIINV